MRRSILAFALLFISLQAQAEDFWHDSVRACVVGGGVVGASSALLLYSAAATATAGAVAVSLPTGAVVLGNTIFGCGLGTIGTMLIYGLGTLYQNMASQAPAQVQYQEPAAVEPQPEPQNK
ncbi:hypothetical protein TI04_06875 [Achromatium sp. WMS2]|nr:hypothetical protein TI04_06875 [Achromatium sp. WMS2]